MKQSILHARRVVLGALLLGSVLTVVPALAKSGTEHLRGTISVVSSNGFTMQTEAGQTREIQIGADTKIAGVVPSSLDQIKTGTFIGTANVKRDGEAQALEVVVFPESMKGAGLGDYPWDLSPAKVPGTGGGPGSMMSGGSSMTNGTVQSSGASASSMNNSMSMGGGGSSMTNGTVTQSTDSTVMTVKVDYGNGSKTIQIPKDVPVVAVQPGSKSDIKTGAHVFVVGPEGSMPFKAARVIVGINGTVPPM